MPEKITPSTNKKPQDNHHENEPGQNSNNSTQKRRDQDSFEKGTNSNPHTK